MNEKKLIMAEYDSYYQNKDVTTIIYQMHWDNQPNQV
jgi:hypothetical protein